MDYTITVTEAQALTVLDALANHVAVRDLLPVERIVVSEAAAEAYATYQAVAAKLFDQGLGEPADK